jgi:murein DD-endopeptidase MepM/ murein hydrolase activator NlpD
MNTLSIRKKVPLWLATLLVLAPLLNACQSQVAAMAPARSTAEYSDVQQDSQQSAVLPVPTLTERPVYAPGELVDYIAQTGDTLPALAVRFNTTEQEIRQANPIIPDTATTMPPGMPMKIPIYYLPLWGSSFQILPDSLFVNGPNQVNFNTREYLAGQPGWLKGIVEFASGANMSAAEIVDRVARDYSVSPQLLLALLEYQSGALTEPVPSNNDLAYPMGYLNRQRKGLYSQLIWTANLLNNGYYGWRLVKLTSIEMEDGRQVRFDPWQNAATVSLHNFFNILLSDVGFERAISLQGFAQTYQSLFGDPWAQDIPHIPGSLEQPALYLPFRPGPSWAYTGGPHNPWGNGEPFAALDFAPPLTGSGCLPSSEWVTAVSAGTVVRSETGQIMVDMDGDGDERTGWNIFYLHLASEGRVPIGTVLQAGDPVGYPSCEGGSSTGTHVHIARKYNGEWIPADGSLAFNLEGWIAHNGSQPYLGTLTRDAQVVIACTCSNAESFIRSDRR